MTLSNDCFFAYLVGEKITIINLRNFSSAFVDKTIEFPHTILWVGVPQYRKRLYLDCGPFFYVFNVENSTSPFIMSIIKKNNSVTDRQNLIYTKDLEYFIYLPGGDFLVENSSYYFINFDANKIPQIGIETIFTYVTVDLTSGVIGNEVIDEIFLMFVSASQAPLKQPLPSWIKFEGSINSFAITVPKTYQYENLYLLISYKGGVHEQILKFSYANQTLVYNNLTK